MDAQQYALLINRRNTEITVSVKPSPAKTNRQAQTSLPVCLIRFLRLYLKVKLLPPQLESDNELSVLLRHGSEGRNPGGRFVCCSWKTGNHQHYAEKDSLPIDTLLADLLRYVRFYENPDGFADAEHERSGSYQSNPKQRESSWKDHSNRCNDCKCFFGRCAAYSISSWLCSMCHKASSPGQRVQRTLRRDSCKTCC